MNKEIRKTGRELARIEKKIEYFMELIKKGIISAQDNTGNSLPCIWYEENMQEITLYDNNKDQVYHVPIKELLSLNLQHNNKCYILDITNLLTQYIKTTIKLLQELDESEKKENK